MKEIEYVEVNPINRWDIINKLIDKNNYKSYLEIGISNPNDCYLKIKAEDKVGVDPHPLAMAEGVQVQTSNDFFYSNKKKFDIIFVDGLHKDFQAILDIENGLKILNEGGTIVVHDCFPRDEITVSEDPQWHISPAWCGTVFRAWLKLRASRDDLSMYVVATDCGCGVIHKGSQEVIEAPDKITWDWYKDHYETALNLKSVYDFYEIEEL